MNQFPSGPGFGPGSPGMFPGRMRGFRVRGPAAAVVAVIALVVMIGIAARACSAVSVSHSGPCMGGPAPGTTGQPLGHGNYRFPCADGGSTVVHLGG